MIEELLSRGRGRAVPLTALCEATGKGEREVRKQISRERLAGALILSAMENGGGYYLPADGAEVRSFARSMAHRAAETMTIARLAEDAAADLDGQTMLEGWQNG